MNKRIPIFVLTGFLGSGKTTVLQKMLSYIKQQGQKPALILNELGSENVEKELFQVESMIEMLNGCICCTIQDDMRVELERFLQTNADIDVLLIEGTGIANPAEIIEALTHPNLMEQVEIQSVIGLVDASRFLEYQSIFQSSKEIRTMLKQQVTSSTLIVINKIDLLENKKLNKVTAKINESKTENVPIIYSSFGNVDEQLLFQRRFFQNTVNLKEEVHHHHHHHSHPFQAVKIVGIESIDRKKFERWLKNQSLLRAKGYVLFEGQQQLFSFQFSSGQLHVTSIETNVSPCFIFIGNDIDENKLIHSFEKEVMQIH
ncbi:CobW family GTP-binding protein [Halalkalibacter akibai]|uniref:Metal chaperone n=1 Tax=Halalkalibacter akibai (strain ATCC 43226 / DSM 21942 / CIP 109018 / JCM 9157 / 1139) TaxID=1236973 RepID=W4QXI6_HALA3|nr:GTP-binding protein [Halalkalibacter akibai]GAE36845.1 metal chaperone [Halalkalibacter akibai JCM 9157]